MLPAVSSYLITISSFVLGCEKMRKTSLVCILEGKQWDELGPYFIQVVLHLGMV